MLAFRWFLHGRAKGGHCPREKTGTVEQPLPSCSLFLYQSSEKEAGAASNNILMILRTGEGSPDSPPYRMPFPSTGRGLRLLEGGSDSECEGKLHTANTGASTGRGHSAVLTGLSRSSGHHR